MALVPVGPDRGIGGVGHAQDLFPDGAAFVFGLLTQLGDVWFLGTLLAILYWTGWPARSDVGFLAGSWLTGMGVYRCLKEVIGSPRPNEPLLDPELVVRPMRPIYEATAFSSGYGFPSGHAVNATVAFVGLAAILPFGSIRQRYLAAGGLVALVSLTRVVLGLHYLVDVIAGVIVGVTVLLGVWLLGHASIADRETVGFGVAIVAALCYALVSQFAVEAVVLLGGAVGAFGGWQLVMLHRPRRASVPAFARKALAGAALGSLVLAIGAFPLSLTYAAGGGAGLVVCGVITWPTLRVNG